MTEWVTFVHPAYFARGDAPKRHPKPEPRGKRYSCGIGWYEVRRWGVYAASGRDRWTTWLVPRDGTPAPLSMPGLVRPSFTQAEKALAAFARRGGFFELTGGKR